MKKILFLFTLLLAGIANAQTPVIIHGTGSLLFFDVNPSGDYFEISSPEIWLNSDGSQTFKTPVFNPVLPPMDEEGVPMPNEWITCAAGQHFAQSPGAHAVCGPTKVDLLPGGDKRMSCNKLDAWLCKLETFMLDGTPVTYWNGIDL